MQLEMALWIESDAGQRLLQAGVKAGKTLMTSLY